MLLVLLFEGIIFGFTVDQDDITFFAEPGRLTVEHKLVQFTDPKPLFFFWPFSNKQGWAGEIVRKPLNPLCGDVAFKHFFVTFWANHSLTPTDNMPSIIIGKHLIMDPCRHCRCSLISRCISIKVGSCFL